jgi:hypothetical protein
MNKRTVLLYGRSLLLSGVAAGLKECVGLRVVHAATWEDVSQLLAARTPDVLMFHLHDADEYPILALLFANPGLMVVGLDAESNRAVLVSGQEAGALTLNQIQQIAGGAQTTQDRRTGA